MKHSTLLTLPALLLLNACAAIEPAAIPAAPPTAAQPAETSIPYPRIDAQSQIDNLGIQVARLEQQLESLQTRIQQLERQRPAAAAATRRTPVTPARQTVTPAGVPAYVPSANTGSNRRYEQALQQYRNGNYAATVNLLRNADNGGNGSESARKSMYLLLQSHLRLANCESVINIGNRYANSFRSSAEAPDALYSVAECQARMQQRDIARDTWRKLIQTYPDSNAAKRAYQQLNTR